MAVLDARSWLEILPEAECWRLLRLSSVGRLAVVHRGEPMIWPLNIAVDDRDIVFRTAPGAKASSFYEDPAGAFEVDGLDFEARRGWSVVVTGRIRELSGEELERARRLPLAPWTVGEKQLWFALRVERISGRGIGDRAAVAAR